MNSLSWMIYAADALGRFSGAIEFAAFAVGGLWIFGLGVFGGRAYVDGFDEAEPAFKWFVRKLWVPVVCTMLFVITPSQNTIYMIASSEAGETIIKSPEAKEVFDDLKTILKSKLKEQLPKV